ncbi:MAG TPA: glycoside hydrolase domain-containing protein [Candidatus Dormibacteraeota bacterium]|nr:glycoside hydrolase domain-containing protein [Candidatus Dormibacteraeota bacterium]
MQSPRISSLFARLRGQALRAAVAALVVSSQLGQATPAIAAPGDLPASSQVTQISAVTDPIRLSLPAGSRQCPDSGRGASCNPGDSAAQPTPGVASLPGGQSACPTRPDGPNAPASCNDTLLPSPAPQPAAPVATPGSTFVPHTATPSVPIWTLTAAGSQPRVRLESDVTALKPGQNVMLTATASLTVTGTRSAIEIFDQTTGTLVGACMQSSQCQVAYAASSGVHTFAAYLTPPVANQPTENVITSNPVLVSWFSVALIAASPAMVGPGKPITITATTTADVASSGYQLGLYDQRSGVRLTYCSHGTTCSTTLTKDQSGVRPIVAYVSAASQTSPLQPQAQSKPMTATWLGVTLDANTTNPQRGDTVFMRATANVDVTNTPWSIGIYDQNGELVANACKTGSSCSARIAITTGSTPWFTAVVGAARPVVADQGSPALVKLVNTVQAHSSLVNIQVRSAAVQPTRLLWGVDSCKPFTTNTTASRGLYPQVQLAYGAPDFWGRYLTQTYNCPGISSAEIAAAALKQMGILPIYNNYDCSAVHSYATGQRYASEASAAATSLGIPSGTVLAIDIEPPGDYCPGAGSVDAGFISGWFDGITFANFVPMYYGNGTAGTEFASAWCRAVSARPEIAMSGYLWSFEPSLQGRYTKAKAPEYTPELPGCSANMAAWQYMLSAGGRPDVDSDEAISKLPLWFPKATS